MEDRQQQKRPLTRSIDVSVPRSCHACNRQKIRCDKKTPCASCARSGRACSYPAAGPRTRRTKKTMMAEMASRISSLEKSLAQAQANATAAETGARSHDRTLGHSRSPHTDLNSTTTPTTTESSDAAPATARTKTIVDDNSSGQRSSREDILVQKGSSSQYFNEILLSRVIEEERNVESALTTSPSGANAGAEGSSSSAPGPPPPSPFNALGILSSPCFAQPPWTFHPPKSVAVRLWNVYVHNVEGCAGLKVLHLPTDEVKVYSTIDRPATASLDNLGLCFAIYFASTVSLDEGEAKTVFADSPQTNLLDFKLGLEQAFAQGDFLDRPTLTALHALAIYLAALRVHNRGKGIWILNGLAIRMAESLGLRRDGERLGLSPFSSEIRRRLWWHFLTRDSRAGEDYGLQNKTSPLLESEACLPLNVDDTDLYPSMKQLPQNKPGWTSMTFSLVNIDLAKTMQELATMAATSPPTRTPSESRREQVIDQLRTRIEWRLEHCNPVIPQQRLTLFCSRWLLRKLDFITRLQWALSQQQQQQHQPSASTTAADGGRLRDHLTTERNLVEALDILEPRLAGEDDLLKQFAWARRAYPQYHVTLYILWHLCVNHDETPSVARAWRAMETLFSSKDHWDDLASPGFGPKSAVLTALRAKAVALRNKGQNQRHPSTSDNDSVLNPETGPSAMATMTASVPESAPSYPLPPPLEDMDGFGGDFGAFDFDIASDEWPNWETLAQGFQPDGQGQQQTWTSPGASWR